MTVPRSLRAALPVLALLLAASPAAAQQPARPLANLSFMSGCWRADGGVDRTVEEHWGAADSDVMLSTTRYLDDNTGRTRGFEFSRIVADSAGTFLLPAPSGDQRGRFRMTRSSASEATFEDPAHDYPRRIAYRRLNATTMVALVDGGEGDREGQEYRMTAIPCPSAR